MNNYLQAPEIIKSDGFQPTYRSSIDVWSLGCVIYEIITFQKLFTAKTRSLIKEEILINSIEKVIDTNIDLKLYENFISKNLVDKYLIEVKEFIKL